MNNLNTINPIKVKNMEDFFQNIYYRIIDLIGTLFFVFLGYFSPVSSVIHVILGLFVLDIIYGWQADVKLNNGKFQPSIVWQKSIPRMVLALIAVLSAYMLDTEMKQDWVDSSRIVGFIIGGLLFMSIIKNGLIVTRWGVLKAIQRWAKKEVKEKTGLDIKDEEI